MRRPDRWRSPDGREASRASRRGLVGLALIVGSTVLLGATAGASARAQDEHLAFYNQAIEALEAGDLPGAKAALRRALELAPGHALSHYTLGYIHLREGNVAEAEAALLRSLELDPDLSRALRDLGILHVAEGRRDEAYRSFEAAMSAGHVHDVGVPPESRPAFDLATFYLRQGRLEEAERELAGLDDEVVGPALAQLGQIYLDEGLVREAANTLESALRHGAGGWETHFRLATCYTRLIKYGPALEQLRRAAEIDPAALEIPLAIAGIYRFLGEADEAIARYAELIERVPNDVRAYYQSAHVHADRGELGVAIGHLERVLELRADYAGAHYLMGKIYSRQQEFERAEEYLRVATRLAPGDPLAHYALGIALQGQGKVAEGKRELQIFAAIDGRQRRLIELEKQLSVDPVDADLRYRLARAYVEAGRDVDARRHLTYVLWLEPDHAEARALLEEIDRR